MTDSYAKKQVINIVRETITKFSLIPKGSGVVIAVSGGPDSMALLHILNVLKDELSTWFTVAHLDHCLRPRSSDESELVKKSVRDLGIPMRLKRQDIGALAESEGVSIEEAGRIARYQFFEETRISVGAQLVSTGHQIDDSLETFFLRLFRGSSLAGLGGILPQQNRIVRPLTELRRNQIMEYLHQENIQYIVDPTNLETNTDRNFIRNRLFPVIKERFPQFSVPLKRTLDLVLDEEDFLQSAADELYAQSVQHIGDEIEIRISLLAQAPRMIARRVLVKAFYDISGPHTRWTRSHVDSVLDIALGNNPSAALNLPTPIIAQKNYDRLLLHKKLWNNEVSPFEYHVTGPSILDVKEAGARLEFRISESPNSLTISPVEPDTALFDADLISFPLVVRSPRPGDKFQPWGMEGSRKIKEILIDEKIPRKLRATLPLVAKDHSILWLVGIRRSSLAPIDSNTTRVLEIIYSQLEK
jgi:tRNA(Ile)-lysidine synthase